VGNESPVSDAETANTAPEVSDVVESDESPVSNAPTEPSLA
jgi:hypothetical protein